MSDQPAYLLLLASGTERRRFADDVAAMSPQMAGQGGRLLALAPAPSVETFGHNHGPTSVMVSQWRDIECLRGFWHSSGHRRVADPRSRCGAFVAVALEGSGGLPTASTGDAVLALFLGAGPSPALLEAEGARPLTLLRESQVESLEGQWTHGDVAIYGWTSAHSARRLLVTFCSGQRGRALMLPALAAPRAAPATESARTPLFADSFAA
jgi:uncharacterized protein (DUF1330 family)